jgi:hypothetical protein
MAPWRDPRTGILYYRKRLPAHLRGLLGWELKRSLDTRDMKVAKRLYPHVASKMQKLIDEAQERYHEQIIDEQMPEDYEQPTREEVWQAFLDAMSWDELKDVLLGTFSEYQRDLWHRMARARQAEQTQPNTTSKAASKVASKPASSPASLYALLDQWAASRRKPEAHRLCLAADDQQARRPRRT